MAELDKFMAGMQGVTFPDLSYADTELLSDLAPAITRLHDHHLEVAKIWRPSDVIREVEMEARERGPSQERPKWSAEAKSSSTLGLITEKGLPYYVKTILRDIPRDHPFALWAYRWTGEEERHAAAIYGAMMASGAVDMAKMDDDTLVMFENADTPEPESFAETLVYPAPQERATRLNHIGSARLIPDDYQAVKKTFTTIAGDENLHFNIYRDFTTAAIEVNPSIMAIAIAKQFIEFAMPGTGIPNYIKHAVRVSGAGVYGLPEQEEIFSSLIDIWGVYKLENLSSDAEYALDALALYMVALNSDAAYISQRRADKSGTLQTKHASRKSSKLETAST